MVLNSTFRFAVMTLALALLAGSAARVDAQEPAAPAPAASTLAPKPIPPGTVVATVNGIPVTQAQVELFFSQYMTLYGEEMKTEGQAAYQEQASKQALALALKSALVRQLSAARGLSPTSAQIVGTRGQIHAALGLETPEQFEALVRQRGIPESEIDTWATGHLLNLLLYESYTRDNPTTITTVMAKMLYDNNSELHNRPPMAQLSQIVILTAGLKPEEKAARRAKADETLAALRAGADFAKTAAEVSDDPMGQKGGAYGWVKAGDLEPELAEAVFALKPGQMSGIVESSSGFHILKVDATKPAESLSFERVAPVIIPQLKAHLEKSKFQEWLDIQMKEAEIVNKMETSE